MIKRIYRWWLKHHFCKPCPAVKCTKCIIAKTLGDNYFEHEHFTHFGEQTEH